MSTDDQFLAARAADDQPEFGDRTAAGRGGEEDKRPSEAALQRLIEAYTERYREAARWKSAIWVGSAALFGAGVILALLDNPSPTLGLIAAGYAVCARLVVRPESTRAHREAVTLQEQYETQAFGLPWNRPLAGRQLPQVDVEDLAGRGRTDPDRLRRWNVDGGGAPQAMRVLLWQLEGATWGRRDHRRCAVAMTATAVLSVATTVVVGFVRDASLTAYVSTLAVPALPWLLDLVDAARLHGQASTARERIEDDLNGLWLAVVSGAEPCVTTAVLRANQDRLFANRLAFGRVPEWFYLCYRDRNERAFSAASRQMLERAGWAE